MRAATERDIASFWDANPCGEAQVGRYPTYEDFFSAYDQFRYAREGHILKCLDGIDWHGKRTLEVGLGLGADSEQLIRRGAIWSGLDLTQTAADRTRMRLNIRQLPFSEIKVGSVLHAPFEDQSFDMVFSHGVLHHIPDIVAAQHEIRRVLKPGGTLVCMLYARWSLNYLVSIAIVRRLGLLVLYPLRGNGDSIIDKHVRNARRMGLVQYLRLANFVHYNTDGPDNPYAQVYDVARVKRDFPDFEVAKAYKRFMWAPPLPISSLPFERQLGWHLWLELQ